MAVSRLEQALQAHEKTLRNELADATRKRTELQTQMRQLDDKIVQTEADLTDAVKELTHHGLHIDTSYVIQETTET